MFLMTVGSSLETNVGIFQIYLFVGKKETTIFW